jgi:flagellar biosynthesis/type III secretory pathway chaperone
LNSDIVSQGCHAAKKIQDILESEFDALKKQDLEEFDSLQEKKASLINFVASLNVPPYKKDDSSDMWLPLREIILECKNLHRRNEILITRKLDSIRAALNTLSGENENSTSVEMYDRLGKIAQKRNKKGFLEA